MTVKINHAKVSGKPAGTDATRVCGNHWDADHTVTGAAALDGGNTFTGTQAITPAAGSLTQGLTVTQNPAGTITGGTFPQSYTANYINVQSDSVNAGDGSEFAALAIVHKTGGPTVLGQRLGLHVQQWMTAATGAETQHDIIGILSDVVGQTGNSGGNFIAAASSALLTPTAVGAGGLSGHEIDIEVQAGATVTHKLGLTIVQVTGDEVQGSSTDAGIAFYNGGTSGGWKSGILFNGSTVAAGGVAIDMSALTPGGLAYALKGPGLRSYIDGSGNAGFETVTTLGASGAPITLNGTSSGFGQFLVQGAMGAAQWTLPTGTGTFVVTASSPLAINATTGNLTISFGAGVGTWLATPTSANLAAAITDETGSGALVFATSPTIATPVINGASFTGTNTFTQAAASAISVRSGASGSFSLQSFGRTATEGAIGVAAAADQFAIGAVAGDFAVEAFTNLWLSANAAAGVKSGIKIDTGGLLTFSQYGAGLITTNSSGVVSASATLPAAMEPAHTGDVTNTAGSLALTLVTAQPAAHTWALAQTFTVAPVFTDQSGSRTALGLGTAATQNTGTSGANLPFLNGVNTWAAAQTLSVAPVFTDQSGSRTALGLGTAATQNTGASGANVPLLNGANTWSSGQTFSAAFTYGGVTLSNSVTGTGSMSLSISPTFTGTPLTPTAAVDANTTQIASTAFVLAQAASATPLIDATVAVVGTSTRFARADHVHPTDTTRAALASPTFTGTPLTTTAAVDTNTTQIASTAFVLAQAASATPLIDGTATVGTSTRFARGDHIHPTDTTRAPLASPTFTGTVTAPSIALSATSTQPNIDSTSSSVTINASSNAQIAANGTYWFAAREATSTGDVVMCLLSTGGGITSIVSGGTWVCGSTTPSGAGHTVGWDGSVFRIYNGTGATRTFYYGIWKFSP